MDLDLRDLVVEAISKSLIREGGQASFQSAIVLDLAKISEILGQVC